MRPEFFDFVSEAVTEIKYKNWELIVSFIPGGEIYLMWKWDGVCSRTCTPKKIHSRKWRLSRHMTKSEIIQTAFKAAITAEEHEAREQFTYKNQAIFGPHFDVDALVDLAGAGKLEFREEKANV